jgi:hypothetical protein
MYALLIIAGLIGLSIAAIVLLIVPCLMKRSKAEIIMADCGDKGRAISLQSGEIAPLVPVGAAHSGSAEALNSPTRRPHLEDAA